MPYKISGNMSENCNIKIFQGDDYIGYREATGGTHNTVFDLTTSGVVTAVGENSDGRIVGYGNVLPTSTGDGVNVTSPAGGAAIKNIQMVNIPLGAAETSHSTAITEVSTSNTMLVSCGWVASTNATYGCIYVDLEDSTHVRARRLSQIGIANDATVSVIEFESGGLNSVQRGVTTSSVQTIDVDITAVDLDKSFISCLGWGTPNAAWGDTITQVYFVDSDTIRIERRRAGYGSCYTSWEVIEFA